MFSCLLQKLFVENARRIPRMAYISEIVCSRRMYQSAKKRSANRRALNYLSVGIAAFAVSFGFVPAYRLFCEKTSYGGRTKVANDVEKISKMEKVEDRLIRVIFDANVPPTMPWEFKPLQKEIYVHPGETALAFFHAYNPSDRPIVGISSYNLNPNKAAYYFAKIQCFCFEEQLLRPKEDVDLPLVFYIDADYANDPQLENLDSVILSYTFYETSPDLVLPSPFGPEEDQAEAEVPKNDDNKQSKIEPVKSTQKAKDSN